MDDFSCTHPIRVAGMCAVCGKTLDDEDPTSTGDGSPQQLHEISGVHVTSAEAARLDSESTRHLLAQRKLALIVDLDQTIIHATVDPTVAEWMKDERNPNYSALADVGKFLLGVDGKPILDNDGAALQEGSEASDAALAQDGCWYYVKPRPGLANFLAQLSQRYEMHVYTMGTRTYAEGVCRLVDPTGVYFGARIISRDENGSLVQKSLNKLFPMDTSMVVIIDDRADVWQWSPNLVQVSPFDFFVGIGDLNATFLPKLAPSIPSPTPEAEEAKKKAEEEQGSTEENSGDGGNDEAATTAKAQAEDDAAKTVAEESQKTAVNEQLGERPLAKMQEALEDGKEAADGARNGDGGQAAAPSAVLNETDRELVTLQAILDEVHARWYGTYDSSSSSSASASNDEKPAITAIISQRKQTVLQGCTILFSSIAPMHQDPRTTDLWRLATEFGAACRQTMDASVTHVVTAKAGTEKVLTGQRRRLHVVWSTWLQESCAHWTRQREETFTLPVLPSRGDVVPSKKDSNLRQGTAVDRVEPDDTSATFEMLGDGGASDIDNEEEAEEEDDDDQGFGEMNWDEANDEVDAVLDGLSDDDDEEDEGTQNGDVSDSDRSSSSRRGKEGHAGPRTKRSRSRRSDGSLTSSKEVTPEPDNGDGRTGPAKRSEMLSPLSKRRRMAELRAGHSKLKQVLQAPASSDSRETSAAPTTTATTASSDRSSAAIGREQTSAAKTASTVSSRRGSVAGDDADFLKSLEDELDLQLGGDEEDDEEEKSGNEPAAVADAPLTVGET